MMKIFPDLSVASYRDGEWTIWEPRGGLFRRDAANPEFWKHCDAADHCRAVQPQKFL